MMNGKKSYLISFTALFSKRGYELKIGFEQIINANNQYHLTAPVNSTYKTLIEDTMKNANKAPHSATGLFGRLGSAEYITQYDGFEVETVVASIVSYLSGIHKYFNGETVTDGTTDGQQDACSLEQILEAEGAAVSEGSRIDKFSHLEELASGDLYDVKVSVAEGNRVSISLSNKQSVIHALESTVSGISQDTQMGGIKSAENGVRLNAEEGRAVLSNIVRSILDGEMALTSVATHDPDISVVGELQYTEIGEVGFDRAVSDSYPLEYAVLVSEGSEQGYELAEIAVKGSSLEVYVLMDTRQEGTLEGREEARQLEVKEDAFVSRTETGHLDMVFDAQTGTPVYAEKRNEAELTLTTVADTYGRGEAEMNEHLPAETLYNEPTILNEYVMVDTNKDVDLQPFTEVRTYQNADAQEFIQTDTVMQASQQDDVRGELIQPVYDGQVERVLVQGENVQDAAMQESLMYDTLVNTQTDEQTTAVTYENGHSIEFLSRATSQVKDARIESTQSVDTSVSADMQEFLTYDTRQDSELETFTRAESWANSLLLIDRTVTADTEQEGRQSLELESGKIEMEYMAGVESLDQSYYFDKHITNSSFSSSDSVKDATESLLVNVEYTSDTAKAGSLTDASSAIGDNEGYLKLVSQGSAVQEYNADIDDFRDVTYVSGDGAIQLISDAEVYVGGDPLVDRFIEATDKSDKMDAEVEEWTEAGMSKRTQAEVESLYTFEQIQGAIAESPEILKAVRLMEIMYGSKAVDLIEAGMENIIQDSITQGFTQADFPAITQTVIEELKQAGAGVMVIASNQEEVHVEHNKGADQTAESPTTGRYVVEPEGTMPQGISGASLSDFKQTADITEISRAIAEANKHIGVIQGLDKAEQKTFGEGVKQTGLTAAETDITRDSVVHLPETALSDPTAEGVGTKLETGLAGMGYEGEVERPDTANQVTSVEAIKQDMESAVHSDSKHVSYKHKTETALSNPTAEGVGTKLEIGLAGMGYEGELERPDTANQVTSVEGIKQDMESAVHSDSKHVSYEHKTETAFNGTGVYGVWHGISLGEQRTDRDAVTHEIEGARISDGNSPTAIQELEDAWQSDVAKETVLYEEHTAMFTDKGYEAVESKLEGATNGKSNDAFVVGLEGATSFISEEAVVHQGESAQYHDGSTMGVIHEGESANIDNSSKVGTISEMGMATTTTNAEAVTHELEGAVSGKDTGAFIQAGELAEHISHQDLAVIEDLESGVRKRLQLETDIQDDSKVTNHREPIETHISEPEEAARPTKAIEVGIEKPEKVDRPKLVLEVDIEQSEGAERPKRVIETTIEKSEGGILKTPEEPKKPRIWLIIGKIASWSIWNWKKTR
ncbi:hypothetical protein [Paenibacillus amylolyticus]|uniref:Uncharacterized protein n=1 Tax=Paenibacillus amylolyticus TaxID=1451 RepID=A0A100VLC9_PAEAM|nr:hypothetical protein [Paenibacillus amylolyticus]GAS82013.1 unknown protein [Paenibacillus amylolyticus]